MIDSLRPIGEARLNEREHTPDWAAQRATQMPPLCMPLDASTERELAIERDRLARNIYQRIQARLPGRVRSLTVYVSDENVVLVGKCNTYYSKQMAQQVAMGVLDYQRIVNNILVTTPR